MNILIIENERPAADKLQEILAKINRDIVVVGITETVEQSINWLQDMAAPDLILMDIQLDDGICFEIFDTITVDIPVIFTTAYNDYVLQAFKVNSVDYILKPIAENELRNALNKFKTVHGRLNEDTIRDLFKELHKQYKTRFLIKIGLHYKSVSINEICCFYIVERAVFVKTYKGLEYAIDYSLDHIQKIIDPNKYFRLNRNCIVCIDAITDIVSFSSSRLQLILDTKNAIDKSSLVVSRDKVRKFKKWVDR